MVISALISASNPEHGSLLRRLDIPLEMYRSVFTDAAWWRLYVEQVCARHAVEPRSITSGVPGSFPTFIVNQMLVVKFFGPLFDGLQCWRTEIEAATMLGKAMPPLPIPGAIEAGVLSDTPPWRYIVSRFVVGETFGRARDRLDRRQRERLAHDLEVLLRRVHDLDVPVGSALRPEWDSWSEFVDSQRRGVVDRHRAWGKLPERLILELDRYLEGYSVETKAAPVLVHADLHEGHVLGAMDADHVWQISGVIDWGDARVGDRFYELPALHLGLFHGDLMMLSAFLDAYEWPGYRTDDFVHRAMKMTLLHEFNVLERIDVPNDVESLDQLAENLWRV